MVGMGFGWIGVGWVVLVCVPRWIKLKIIHTNSRHSLVFTFEAHDILRVDEKQKKNCCETRVRSKFSPNSYLQAL